MKKIIIMTSMVLILLFGLGLNTVVLAAPHALPEQHTTPTDPSQLGGGASLTKIESISRNIWSTITALCQIAGFALILFAGLKYMFSSADRRGELKQKLVFLVIGLILVFASPTVITFIDGIIEDVLG